MSHEVGRDLGGGGSCEPEAGETRNTTGKEPMNGTMSMKIEHFRTLKTDLITFRLSTPKPRAR